jgi:hypothetical protein
MNTIKEVESEIEIEKMVDGKLEKREEMRIEEYRR